MVKTVKNTYRRYWMRVISDIEKISMSKIARKHGMTYSTVFILCKKFIDDELVTVKKKKKINIFKLTDKGKEMKKAADIIINNTGGFHNKHDIIAE